MICPICKSTIKDESKFCGRCGRIIPRCPTCGMVITKKMKFCTNDGTPLPEDIISLFSDVASEEPNQTDAKPKKKKRLLPVLIFLVIFLFLCASVTIGYTYFLGKPPWETIRLFNNEEEVQTSEEETLEEKEPLTKAATVVETESEQSIPETSEQETSEEQQTNVSEEITQAAEEAVNDGGMDMAAEDKLEYFITHCDIQYFSRADLTLFDSDMCRLARNGIYARAGRQFEDVALQNYFAQYDWYQPRVAAKDFSEAMLNEYQIANRDLIVSYEEQVSLSTNMSPDISMEHVTEVRASSSLSEHNMTHFPSRVMDGDLSTAWVEGASGQGIGETIVFTFDNDYKVSGLIIYAGYQKSEAVYKKNSRPKKILISFYDGSSEIHTLQDTNSGQRIVLDESHITNGLVISIQSVYEGEVYQDTCISEVYLY